MQGAVSATAGPASARIVNSVTDTDYSFRRKSTRIGWTLGVGIETDSA